LKVVGREETDVQVESRRERRALIVSSCSVLYQRRGRPENQLEQSKRVSKKKKIPYEIAGE